MSKRFEGMVVLISGAASGFGKAAAVRLAGEGAKLVLSDLVQLNLAPTVAACTQAGAEVAHFAGDIGEEATAKALVDLAVARFGRLDRALNNAGIAHAVQRLGDIDVAVAANVIRVDLFGVFLAMKYQLPVMAAQGGGAVLNVASVAGLIGAPLMSVYSAAKHGVVGLTKSASAEYAGKGVRVNAICPSFADTPMVAEMLDNGQRPRAEQEARLTAFVPMRRIASADEIVEAMLWMLSPANSFMNGHALAIDGGLSAI